MNNSASTGKSLVILIQAMSGSIDWILPVCKHIKDHHPDTGIYFVLLRYSDEEIFNGNELLKMVVSEISENRCLDLSFFFPTPYKVFRRLLFRVFFHLKPLNRKMVSFFDRAIWRLHSYKRAIKWISGLHRPMIMLKDGLKQPSNICMLFIRQAELYKAKVISFPTAPSFTFSPGMWIDFKDNNNTGNNYCADYAIIDKHWDIANCRDYSREAVVVGTPKFDQNWIDYLRSRYDRNRYTGNFKIRPVVVLLKNEQSFVFKHLNFRDLLEEILETLVVSKGYNVILKPHPRQNVELLNDIIGKFHHGKVIISCDPAFQVIDAAQYVIAMPSGVILDALMMGVPVIEYYNYSKLNEILLREYDSIPRNSFGGMSALDNDGHLTSVFRAKRLVIPADTPEELERSLNRLESQEAHVCITNAREIFSENKAEKAAEFIMNLFKNN